MTFYFLIITCLFSIIAFKSNVLMYRFIFNPYIVKRNREWYRFFTCGLIHADWLHLIINMFVLYSFGNAVEYYYFEIFGSKGWYYFLILYVGGILISIVPTYARENNNPSYNALGASGAVSAVVFSYIIFNPWEKIYLYGILGLPGIIVGGAYLAYSYYMSKRGGDNINHDAHMWGAVFGVLYTILLDPELIVYFFKRVIDFS